MLNRGEILEDKYRIEKYLFESQKSEYYLAFKVDGNIPVVVSACTYDDAVELENRLEQLNNVNKYIDAGILKIIDFFRKESCLYSVQVAPKGEFVKETLLTQGPYERKTALQISIELAELLAGLFGRWPRRLVSGLSIDRVCFSQAKHVEVIAADEIMSMSDLGRDGEKECIRELGFIMYQMVTGAGDIESLRKKQDLSVEVPLSVSGIGKRYNEVIRKCINAGYASEKNPFKQIGKELKQAKMFDGIFGFSRPENIATSTESTETIRYGTEGESNNNGNQNISQIESDTVRLDQEILNPEVSVQKAKYAGRFDIVRNDIWIHTMEKI